MYLKSKTNKEIASILKKNYEVWKREGLSKSGYFIIFDGFLKNKKLKNINGNALKLYIYLGINSNNMTGEVWHSNKSIAKYFGKSERTIRCWMKELEDMHLIKRFQLEFNGESHNFIQPYSLKDDLLEDPSTPSNIYIYRYRLKDINHRKNVNLIELKDYIIKGIQKVFPDANIDVYEDYFEFYISYKASSVDLRKMGYEIKNTNPIFENFLRRYEYRNFDGSKGVSTQLFENVKI